LFNYIDITDLIHGSISTQSLIQLWFVNEVNHHDRSMQYHRMYLIG